MTAHILSGNFATKEAVSLDNEAHTINPSVCLPQKTLPWSIGRLTGIYMLAPRMPWMSWIPTKQRWSPPLLVFGTMQDMGDFTRLCINSDTVVMGIFSPEGPQPLYHQFLLIFIKTVNSHDWVDWFAKNGGNMPDLHWHLYVYVKRIFNLLADFLMNFGNINVVTRGRPISELNTRSLTKALAVMKAFITQVGLVQ
jgi:hypothetical protein